MHLTYDNQAFITRCASLGLSLAQAQRLAGAEHSPQDLAHVLGLNPDTLLPLRPRNWLLMAAATCSVSYTEPLTSEGLVSILTTGVVPPSAFSTILHFLDEAPLQVVVMAIEQASKQSGLSPAEIWRYVDQIAAAWSSTRLRSIAE